MTNFYLSDTQNISIISANRSCFMKYMLYNIKITIAHTHKKQYLCSRIINPLIISNMNRKKKNQEAVEAFKQLLKSHHAWTDYMRYYSISANIEHATVKHWHWLAWATQAPPRSWIICAFSWANDKKKPARWSELSVLWCKWCDENLKK